MSQRVCACRHLAAASLVVALQRPCHRGRPAHRERVSQCVHGGRRMAVANLVLAPFLLAFLLIYFFMRNAERLYHQPSAAGARRWSPLAAWRLREFNELPHYTAHRRARPPAKHLARAASARVGALSRWCGWQASLAGHMVGSNSSVSLLHAHVEHCCDAQGDVW